jgi:aspartate racemase
LIHIAEAAAKEILSNNVKKVALLGTKFVMERPFFRDKLALYGIESILPNEAERNFIHATIFNELTRAIFNKETRDKYSRIIERLIQEGADELFMLVPKFQFYSTMKRRR